MTAGFTFPTFRVLEVEVHVPQPDIPNSLSFCVGDCGNNVRLLILAPTFKCGAADSISDKLITGMGRTLLSLSLR